MSMEECCVKGFQGLW